MSGTVTITESSQLPQKVNKRPRIRLLFSPASGPTSDKIYTLTDGKNYIGRALSKDQPGISLAGDSGMSSLHALLEVSPDTFEVRVTDCKSKNGSYIGTQAVPVQPAACLLRDGEVLRLGNSFLLLRYEPARAEDAKVPSLIGVSLAMRELRARLEKIAPQQVPVMVCGETGTGKDVVANALHKLSRRSGELVAVNCAAIPESLAESELFGHVAGAFNEARERPGRFRRADRGTLFLDEIGDMPIELQAKLLRALEEKTITPVGQDRPIPCDVRVVAATNHDLQADIASAVFREDLYARLAYFKIVLPPLRARREDILPLLRHISAEAMVALTPALVRGLLTYDWPTNIRELISVAERLRIEGVTEDLLRMLGSNSSPSPPREALAEALPVIAPASAESSVLPVERTRRPYRLPIPNREHLEALMQKHLGTVVHVAEELGCSRRQVQRWLDQQNMRADDYRKLP